MILSAHALAGTAAAFIFRSHPLFAFCAAFASHFLLDAIPHLDFPIRSLERADPLSKEETLKGVMQFRDKSFLHDVLRTGADFCAGTGIAFLAAYPESIETALIVVLGVLGGVLPDFLQLFYYLFKKGPSVYLQRFHVRFHAKIHIARGYAIAAFSQLPFVMVFAALIFLFKK